MYQTRAAALAEHVFQRFDDLGVRECRIAAMCRHLFVTMQCVALQSLKTLSQAWFPRGFVTDLGGAKQPTGVACRAGALPDLLAGLHSRIGAAASGRRRGRSRLGSGITCDLHVTDWREPLVDEFFLDRAAAVVGARLVIGDGRGDPVHGDGENKQDAEHQQERIVKMLVVAFSVFVMILVIHGCPLW